MSDEGFGRNLTAILGTDIYKGMDESPIASITLSPDKEILTFQFENGKKIEFEAEGDCCSKSWIEHLEVPNDIAGQTLKRVSDARISRNDGDEDSYECIQVYNTKFITNKGEVITIEYRNSSNGYYGGYLVRKGDK